MEHYAGELMGSGCNCPRRTEFGAHAAEELPELRLIAVKRLRSHAQGDRSSVFDGPRFGDKTLPPLIRLSRQSPSQEVKFDAAEAGSSTRQRLSFAGFPFAVSNECLVCSGRLPVIGVT
jgi:hypothetical protein